MTRNVVLSPDEILILDRQDPETKKDGGYQSLLVRLQERVDRATGALALTDEDLERIPRYAFDYKNGGWEDRLRGIFRRHLGPRLGRGE
ncbi:MAG: aspartyl-tRNA synthetase [Planctomycetes bacterium]|nr:aspartyl-tRNA synthetase [Planctomycetota bacterium]